MYFELKKARCYVCTITMKTEKSAPCLAAGRSTIDLVLLPALRTVARVRAGARGWIPARGTGDVYHAVVVRCRIHSGRAVARAVAGAARQPLRVHVVRVMA